MPREESEREDLLRDATALVERIELRSVGDLESPEATIVFGFRVTGGASIFFGSDPAYQFNSAGEFRRAYCDGLLFKAAHGRLVSLQRVRQPRQVELRTRDLTDVEQRALITAMQDRLRDLATDLDNGRYYVAGQVPADVDVLLRVRRWLDGHDGTPIATSPRV